MKDWFKKNINYFTWQEFGAHPEKTAKPLLLALDRLRDKAACPIIIHCAYDTSGHSPNSYHYKGSAADLHFKGNLTPLEQYCFISMVPGLNGVGWYPGWNNPGWHVDLRPKPLRWVRENGVYCYDVREFCKALSK